MEPHFCCKAWVFSSTVNHQWSQNFIIFVSLNILRLVFTPLSYFFLSFPLPQVSCPRHLETNTSLCRFFTYINHTAILAQSFLLFFTLIPILLMLNSSLDSFAICCTCLQISLCIACKIFTDNSSILSFCIDLQAKEWRNHLKAFSKSRNTNYKCSLSLSPPPLSLSLSLVPLSLFLSLCLPPSLSVTDTHNLLF